MLTKHVFKILCCYQQRKSQGVVFLICWSKIMETLGNTKVAKSCTDTYTCEYCDYSTSRKSSYDKHLATDKHLMLTNAYFGKHKCICGTTFKHKQSLYRHKKTCMYEEFTLPKVAKVANCFQMFPDHSDANICECGKSYKTRSGLWKHQKTCRVINCNSSGFDSVVVKTDNSEVLEILGSIKDDNQCLKDDNKLLKEKITELESGVMSAVSEPKTVNNYNNIVFLLNEKCSDAIAITDFAKQIVMQIEDVDYAMENGKVRGIENIIRKKFEELGTFKRPLHCTDVKRGTLYVKNEEGWEKEKGEINKMIRDVECAQSKGIKVWSEANPAFSQGNTRLMDKWLRIVQCLTGSIEGIGMRKIEKRCHEICKIDQNVIV